MERFAWKARLLPGKLDEYRKRHDEIWPEMTKVLNDAGVTNYSIWTDGETLFGYYECESVAEAAKVQASSPVVDRWNVYMKDVMVMDFDPETGTSVQLQEVFRHEGNA
ncbi:MAG: L-rhamnose mutarotase [Clostridiales bacterium]|nr:L-rhamnose mutarotase [Clostridiales bacterium]